MSIHYGFKLVPSSVSRFFSYNCDRYFVYNFFQQLVDNSDCNTENTNESNQLVIDNKDIMPELTGDGFSAYAGNIWENTIYNSILKKSRELSGDEGIFSVVNCDTSDLSKVTNPAIIMECFNHPADDKNFLPVFLYQPSFYISDNDPFLGITGESISRIKSDRENYPKLVWGKTMPDFVLVEKSLDEESDYVINIIDAKLARYPHISHKMQVAFYALLLNQFMKEYCDSDENMAKNENERFSVVNAEKCIFKCPLGSLIRINNMSGFVFANRDEVDLSKTETIAFESLEDVKKNFFEFDLKELDNFIEEFFENRVCSILTKTAQIIQEREHVIGNNSLREIEDTDSLNKLKLELAEKMYFCIGSNCDGCGSHVSDGKRTLNSKTCIEWGKRDKSIQLYPEMTRRAQRHIQEYAKEHEDDFREYAMTYLNEGNRPCEIGPKSLLSYDNIVLFIDYLRSRQNTEESKEEDKKKEKLYEELKANYSWNKYASFNNFKNRMVKALNRRYDDMVSDSDVISALISLEENEENERQNEYNRERNIETEDETLLENIEPSAFRKYSFNSMNIPRGQDIAVFMDVETAISKDGKEMVYAYNIRLHLEKYASNKEQRPVQKISSVKELGLESSEADADSFDICEVAETLDRENDLLVSFIDNLYKMVRSVDAYNESLVGNESEALFLQAYTFDGSEHTRIRELLYDCYMNLYDEKTEASENGDNEKLNEVTLFMGKVQSILFWLQSDKTVGVLDEQPDAIREVPIVVLLDDIKRLFEIPAYVTVNMWNVCRALIGEDKGLKAYTEKYCSTFFDSINIKSVYELDENDGVAKLKNKKGFTDYYRLRFDMVEEILHSIQHKYQKKENTNDRNSEKEGIGLYNQLIPFSLPVAKDISDKNIAKLIMLRQDEFYHEYCDIKNTVMRSPASAIAAGKIIVAVYESEIGEEVDREGNLLYGPDTGRYKLKMDLSESIQYEKMYEAYLIWCRNLDSDDAGRDILSKSLTYDNLLNYSGQIVGQGEVRCIKIENTSEAGDNEYITFDCKEVFEPRESDKFLIIEKPSDFTTRMEIEALETIDIIARVNDEDEITTNTDILKLLSPSTFYMSSETMHSNAENTPFESSLSGVWTDENLRNVISSEQPSDFCRLTRDSQINFEKSQWETFKHLCGYNITLLQGPPGTGKTDCIGRSVISLAKTALKRNDGKPFRVLVGGFTHASINNAVKKIYTMAEKAEAPDGYEGSMKDYMSFFKDKDGDTKGYQVKEIEEIIDLAAGYEKPVNSKNKYELGWKDSFMIDKEVDISSDKRSYIKGITVHGTTCWQAYLTNPEYLSDEDQDRNPEDEINFSGFDLIIIDEASQLTVGQAFILMTYGRAYKTHFLIVGDNHQLPPIIRGNYIAKNTSSNIYGSVFDYFMDENRKLTTGDRNYLYSLNSEFRMNEALCNYSAEKIYNIQNDFRINNKRYTAFAEGGATFVRNQAISYKENYLENNAISEWAKNVMDPKYPLTVIYIDGKIPEKVRKAEIKMVSYLKDLFEENMVIEGTENPYFDRNRPELLSLWLYYFWGGLLNDSNKKYCRRRLFGENWNENPLPSVDPFAFGIVTPYNKQKDMISEEIKNGYLKNDIYQSLCIKAYSQGGFQSYKYDYNGHEDNPVYGLREDQIRLIKSREDKITEIEGKYYIYKKYDYDRFNAYKRNVSASERYEIRKFKERPGIPKNKFLIDTVNKLQGQERDAIVVSYGLYDPEMAIAQGEFIYNYQRLNVALTRGKKKTILILSNALADKPIEMLDSNDEDLIKGVSFLCDLKKYMKKEDEEYKIRHLSSKGQEERWFDGEWADNDDGIFEGVSVEIFQKGLR